METVEVVIRIPKDDYDYMKEYRNIRSFCEKYIANQIISGTILSEGHGDLKDVQDIINRINLNYNNQQSIDAYSLKDMIATTQTVIPADRGGKND